MDLIQWYGFEIVFKLHQVKKESKRSFRNAILTQMDRLALSERRDKAGDFPVVNLGSGISRGEHKLA